MSSWYDKWELKINHGKSTRLTFTLNRGIVPSLSLNNQIITKSSGSRFFGLVPGSTSNPDRTRKAEKSSPKF